MKKTTRIITGLIVAALVISGLPAMAAEAGQVNINAAGIEELSLLPRVGPTVAQRIVAFREANGRFKAAADLMLVKGIGEKTFVLIAPYVQLDGETTLTEKVSVPRPGRDSR